MIDVKSLVQTTLDTALGDEVRVYWTRKSETKGEDPDEYVVCTLDDDPAAQFADDRPLTRNANVAIRYYYRDSLLDTSAGRARVRARENQISAALLAAEFSLPGGYFDSGDIDDIGFGTTIFETYFWRLV